LAGRRNAKVKNNEGEKNAKANKNKNGNGDQRNGAKSPSAKAAPTKKKP
jgi:hypothetical protein